MPTYTGKQIADQMRKWYDGGELGLKTVCDTEDDPKKIKEAVQHWFHQGRTRFRHICDRVEALDRD